MDRTQILTELSFRTSRSGGAGGQNVNKVSTKVEVLFRPGSSSGLSDVEKELIHEKCAAKIDGEGLLHIVSQSERTQPGNKRIAVNRLLELLEHALIVRAPRKKKGISRAEKEKRLIEKKRKSELKRGRRGNF